MRKIQSVALSVLLIVPGLPADQSGSTSRQFAFEVFSIKQMPANGNVYSGGTGNTKPTPNGFVSRLSIFQLVMLGYVSANADAWGGAQVRNLPRWDGVFYDINARVAISDLKDWQSQGQSRELLRSAIRAILKDRCKLEIHEEPSKIQVWQLLMSKKSANLLPSSPQSKEAALKLTVHSTLKSDGILQESIGNGKSIKRFYWATMQDLADFLLVLSRGTPIRDRTNLGGGRYDFTLREIEPPSDITSSSPSYFLDKYPVNHLGLQLKTAVESSTAYVIDHIERPTEN